MKTANDIVVLLSMCFEANSVAPRGAHNVIRNLNLIHAQHATVRFFTEESLVPPREHRVRAALLKALH